MLDTIKNFWSALGDKAQRSAKIIAAILLLAVVAVSCGGKASAQDATVTPLQAAHAGLWFDPGYEGQGFDISPYTTTDGSQGAFVLFYGGSIESLVRPTPPTWYFADAQLGRLVSVSTLSQTLSIFGVPNGIPGSALAGSISITGLTCDSIVADVTLDASESGTVRFFLQRAEGAPAGVECYSCPAADFSPPAPGCEFATKVLRR